MNQAPYGQYPNPYQAPYAPPQPQPQQWGGCQLCGAQVPTKTVNLWQNVGAIAVRFHKQTAGNLCKACIRDVGWRYTLITGFFGWWGVISFFFTLFILPNNMRQMFSARNLPEVPGRARPKGPYAIITILGVLLALGTAMALLGAVISISESGADGGDVGGLVAVVLFGAIPAGLMMFFGIRGLAAKPA